MNDTLQVHTGKPLIGDHRPDHLRRHRMKNLSNILLDQLGRRAKAGQRTQELVAAALPDPLAKALAFARLDGDCLVLTVTSPGAATRMRFCQRDIFAACARADMRPKTVKFKVAPQQPALNSTASEPQTDAPAPRISDASADQLKSLASGVSCEALSGALTRLASRRNKG